MLGLDFVIFYNFYLYSMFISLFATYSMSPFISKLHPGGFSFPPADIVILRLSCDEQHKMHLTRDGHSQRLGLYNSLGDSNLISLIDHLSIIFQTLQITLSISSLRITTQKQISLSLSVSPRTYRTRAGKVS